MEITMIFSIKHMKLKLEQNYMLVEGVSDINIA